jgi:hypothetical protein
MIYIVLDKTATSRPTPKYSATFLDDGLKIAESKVEQILVNARITLMYSFVFSGQFCG